MNKFKIVQLTQNHPTRKTRVLKEYTGPRIFEINSWEELHELRMRLLPEWTHCEIHRI